MNRWHFDRRLNRVAHGITRAGAIATLFMSILASTASAQSAGSGWNLEPRFYLSGLSFYHATGDASTTYDTFAASGELRFHSGQRPWYASLFADYRFSTDRRQTDQLSIGTYINYGWQRWDARAYVFINQSPRSTAAWLYAGRLRYQLADDHKIGIEAFGTFAKPKSPELMLGYYGDITDRLSIILAAGRGTDGNPDLNARLELVWQIF